MTTPQIQDPERLLSENLELLSKLEQSNQKIIVLQEQLEWFKRQIFGKKSERIARDLNQKQMIFEGFELPEAKEKEKNRPFLLTNGANLIEMAKMQLPCRQIFL